MRTLDSVRPALETHPPIPFAVAEITPFAILDGHGPIKSERFPDSPQAVFTIQLLQGAFGDDGTEYTAGAKFALWLNHKAHTWLLDTLEEGSEPVGPCVLTIIPTKRGSFKTVDSAVLAPPEPKNAPRGRKAIIDDDIPF